MHKLSLTIMIFLLGLTPVLGQTAEDICFDNGGFINPETGICEVRIALEINAAYPVQYADIPFVMEELDSALDSEIQGFMDMFNEGGIFPTVGGWAMDLEFSEVRHSDTIFSVLVDGYIYTGGAHGLSYQYAYTFDTENETVLTLDDVFTDVDAGLAAVAPLASIQITSNLGSFADSEWISDGTASDNPDNYASWSLTDRGISFYFGPYHVAPYAAGPQHVAIPFTELTNVLEPQFVPES